MTEPTIPWTDGLAEFLPPVKKAQSIIRHVIGEHQHVYDLDCDRDFGCECEGYESPKWDDFIDHDGHADHLTDQIMQALTKEGKDRD